MKTNKIAIIAVVLWGVSAIFFGYRFMAGTTVVATDGREAIALEPGERDFILAEMRGFLVAVQEIISAANENDMNAIKEIAHRVGRAEVEGVPPETMLKLPMAFKRLGMSTHDGFDEIVLAAELGPESVMEALEGNLGKCITCHENYRLTTGN